MNYTRTSTIYFCSLFCFNVSNPTIECIMEEPQVSARQSPISLTPSHLTWPNYPVLLTDSLRENMTVPIYATGPCENSVHFIDNKFFIGKIYILIKGLKNAPSSYFSGKRRLFNVTVQGQFKLEGISFASVQTGQIFASQLHLIPPKPMMIPFQMLLERFQPSLRMDLTGNRPYAISPLMSTMQAIGRVFRLV